jgi:AraC family transcriptional regulator
MGIKQDYKKIYIARINKVLDYIDFNIDDNLNLNKLSEVANFSPYHFHRIFSAFTGETLNKFIKRKRVERAASILINEQEETITDIAFRCGFNSIAAFSRTFKDYFKLSATEFKKKNSDIYSKIGKTNSKNSKHNPSNEAYICKIEQLNKWRLKMNTKIEVKNMPEMKLVYCRHTGQFNEIGKTYEKLFKWAGPRGLLKFPETKTMTVYHDNPEVTEIEKVRQSACITVDKVVKTDGEIGSMKVASGKYAVGRFEISDEEFEKAWNSMCLWLADSGYQPADGFPYELYHNDHMQHPERKFILDICIPVKVM